VDEVWEYRVYGLTEARCSCSGAPFGMVQLYAVLTDDFASSTSQVSYLTIEALRGLPFEEDFESYAAGVSLDTKDPDGSHPWTATNVVVTTNAWWAGSQAATLTGETAVATQTFNGGQTNVWTDLYIQPVFGDNSSVQPPPGSSFACYVQTNGSAGCIDQGASAIGPRQTSLSGTARLLRHCPGRV